MYYKVSRIGGRGQSSSTMEQQCPHSSTGLLSPNIPGKIPSGYQFNKPSAAPKMKPKSSTLFSPYPALKDAAIKNNSDSWAAWPEQFIPPAIVPMILKTWTGLTLFRALCKKHFPWLCFGFPLIKLAHALPTLILEFFSQPYQITAVWRAPK